MSKRSNERSSVKTPYRTEAGVFCIDIHVRNSKQLFDGRDPAPFRERDLDEHAVEYLLGAAEDLPGNARLRMVFWIADEPDPHLAEPVIAEAVRSHFAGEEHRLSRDLKAHFRRGQAALAVGVLILLAFLSLAELAGTIGNTHVRQVMREGLVITGWVAMWRPIELLLYDWIPLVRARRMRGRLRQADVSVRYEGGPADVQSP